MDDKGSKRPHDEKGRIIYEDDGDNEPIQKLMRMVDQVGSDGEKAETSSEGQSSGGDLARTSSDSQGSSSTEDQQQHHQQHQQQQPSSGLPVYPQDFLYAIDRLMAEERHAEAEEVIRVVEEAFPDCVAVKVRRQNVDSALVPGWHFAMLNDRNRNEAFDSALRAGAVDKRVVDVGAGAGLLSLFAARAGAERVVAVEGNCHMAEILRKVVDEEGFGDRINILSELSVSLCAQAVEAAAGGPVDLMVTETFDAGLLGEHCLDIFDHAWDNFLRPGHSVVVPRAAELHFFLAECPTVRERKSCRHFMVGDLGKAKFDFVSDQLDTEPYDSEDLRKVPHKRMSPDYFLTEVDFGSPEQVKRLRTEDNAFSVSAEANTEGTVDCAVVWFRMRLDDDGDNWLSTEPDLPEDDEDTPCRWEQAVFPFRRPYRVRPGDVLDLHYNVKGHLTLGKVETTAPFWKADDMDRPHKEEVPVPESLIVRMNDEKLMDFFRKLSLGLSRGEGVMEVRKKKMTIKLLDASGPGMGMLPFTLSLLKHTQAVRAGFYFGDGDDLANMKPVHLLAASNLSSTWGRKVAPGCDRRYFTYGRRDHQKETFSSRLGGVVWDPVDNAGVFEIAGQARDVLLNTDSDTLTRWTRDLVLPRGVHLRCRLFRSNSLVERFRVVAEAGGTEDFPSLVREMNRRSPSRLQDVDVRRDHPDMEWLSGDGCAEDFMYLDLTSTTAGRFLAGDTFCEPHRTEKVVEFDFPEPAVGKEADGILYHAVIDYGSNNFVNTDEYKSFQRAGFLFGERTTVGAGQRGVCRFEQGQLEIKLL